MNAKELWVDSRAVQKATGLSEYKIEQKVRVGEVKSRQGVKRSKNGRPLREYAVESLPPDAQVKLLMECGETRIAKSLPELPLFPETRVRADLPDELRTQAGQRYAIIESLLNYKASKSQGRTIELSGGQRVSGLAELASWIAKQQQPPVSTRTLWRWVSKFRKGGFNALADGLWCDVGGLWFFDGHRKAAAFVQTKYLTEGLSVQLAWEALRRDWPGLEKKGKPPSYPTVRSFLASLPVGVRIAARRGPAALNSLCTPHLVRGPVDVMAWWVLDHRRFDVLVRNTIFDHLESNAAYRLELTAIVDWGSRKWVGWCFAPTPSSRTINSALRMAVSEFGFPRNFYWDNGKDFKKVSGALRDVPELFAEDSERLLVKYSVGITHALPFSPRSKPIESHFARVSKRFDPCWRPAYLGNRPGARPEDADRAEKQHKEFLAGKRASSPLPTDAEFIVGANQFFTEENAAPRESLKNSTPDEVFAEHYPEQRREIPDARLLDVLFSERIRLTVQAGGCVQTKGVRYEPADTASLGSLCVLQGKQILLLRDPYNLAVATAADAETHEFVGDLVWQEFIAQCPNGRITQDQIAAGQRRKNTVKRAYMEYVRLIGAIAASQGWKTEAQLLIERSIARTGTDNAALATPGAQRALPGARREQPSSPFVDDAAADVIAAFAPTFISDGVEEDTDFLKKIELED